MPEKLEEEQIRPINAAGDYIDGRVGIDEAHQRSIMHKGVWLHVLTSDNKLLLLRRSSSMATCAGGLSIVGEHSWLGEPDERCARRALHEELPGLHASASSLHPLRAVPRWFLYDYPDDVRHDRALISEWLLSLSLNGSEAEALLHQAGSPTGQKIEASEMRFLSISEYARRLIEHSHSFCAPGLLPAALLDSVADVCHVLRAKGPAPEGCGAVLAWRRHDRLRGTETALGEDFEAEHVVPDPALLCSARRRPSTYASRRLVQRGNCSGVIISDGGPIPRASADDHPARQALRRAGAGAAVSRSAGGPLLISPSVGEPLVQNMVASLVILSLAFLGARRLNRFLKDILM